MSDLETQIGTVASVAGSCEHAQPEPHMGPVAVKWINRGIDGTSGGMAMA